MKNIAIIDYGMGNLRSVQKALEKVGARAQVTDSPQVLEKAAAVVLPGVGAFGEAVHRLRAGKLWEPLRAVLCDGKPFLGICLGLQLLFERSEESPGLKGLGVLHGSVVRFRNLGQGLKVPHMGWNTIQRRPRAACADLEGVPPRSYFYFVHSYYPDPVVWQDVATTTRYGREFCSSVARGTLFASQFHPEKSGTMGLRILRNFVHRVKAC
jgi:glutamine amidotransferase